MDYFERKEAEANRRAEKRETDLLRKRIYRDRELRRIINGEPRIKSLSSKAKMAGKRRLDGEDKHGDVTFLTASEIKAIYG